MVLLEYTIVSVNNIIIDSEVVFLLHYRIKLANVYSAVHIIELHVSPLYMKLELSIQKCLHWVWCCGGSKDLNDY